MKIMAAVVMVVAAGCASAGPRAGEASVGDVSERAAAVPPIYAMIGEREVLGLSSNQIGALDSLAVWLSSANSPLIDRLFDSGIRRDDDPVRRAGDPPRVDREGEPLLREIGANNEAAEAAIQGILTEEQLSTTCRVFGRSRDERRTSIPRSNARLGVAPGFGAPDTGNYVWPWCVPEPET